MFLRSARGDTPEKELRGLSPNLHIHVSVSDLYILRSVLLFSCSRIGRPIRRIYKSLTETWMYCRSCSRAVPFLGMFFSNYRYCVFAVHILAEAFNQTARTTKHWAGKYKKRQIRRWSHSGQIRPLMEYKGLRLRPGSGSPIKTDATFILH